MRIMFAKQIQIVSADPIEVGERRFLPAVLVVTHQDRREGQRRRRMYKMRPIAVVEEYKGEATWHALPDVTQEYLSRMAGLAVLIAVAGTGILLLNRLLRR